MISKIHEEIPRGEITALRSPHYPSERLLRDGLPARDLKVRKLKTMDIWTDAGASFSHIDDRKNMLGKFNKAFVSGSGGFNFIDTTDIVAGAFARFTSALMSQAVRSG